VPPAGLSIELLNKVETPMTNLSVFDLSPPEKLQLVEDLWDDLAANAENVPVHPWQLEELARRKANLSNHPASGLSRDEVKRRIRSRYGR
jgi:putative addiction module component (TIGR02574 family)